MTTRLLPLTAAVLERETLIGEEVDDVVRKARGLDPGAQTL